MVEWGHLQVIKDVIIPLGAKALEARGEAASTIQRHNSIQFFKWPADIKTNSNYREDALLQYQHNSNSK